MHRAHRFLSLYGKSSDDLTEDESQSPGKTPEGQSSDVPQQSLSPPNAQVGEATQL